MTIFRTTTSLRQWPTRRWANIAAANNITDLASLTTYITNTVVDIASARTVFIEIIRAMVEKEEGGEPGA